MSGDEYVPDDEAMEVAWLEFEASAEDINAAAAEFDRFLARVRRDAARSALNGYADALDNNRHAAVWGWHDFVRDAREWASENYPEETPNEQ